MIINVFQLYAYTEVHKKVRRCADRPEIDYSNNQHSKNTIPIQRDQRLFLFNAQHTSSPCTPISVDKMINHLRIVENTNFILFQKLQ